MKIITLIFSILFLLFAVNNCTGPAGPAGKDGTGGIDKQVVYSFHILYFSANILKGKTGDRILTDNPIIKFNIDNFIGVDSVIFVADIFASYSDDNYFPADLFNLTDSVPILNSSVKNTFSGEDTDDPERVESNNIFSSFPKKEIDIAVRIKLPNSDEENIVSVDHGWLFLYRK